MSKRHLTNLALSEPLRGTRREARKTISGWTRCKLDNVTIAVESGLLHGNWYFARQSRCFTWQFQN